MTPTGEFAQKPWNSMTGVFGLLKPGVTRAAAESELTAIQARVLAEAPPDLKIMRTLSSRRSRPAVELHLAHRPKSTQGPVASPDGIVPDPSYGRAQRGQPPARALKRPQSRTRRARRHWRNLPPYRAPGVD